jgi:hypothetical protein
MRKHIVSKKRRENTNKMNEKIEVESSHSPLQRKKSVKR